MALELLGLTPQNMVLVEPAATPGAGLCAKSPQFYRKNASEMKPQSARVGFPLCWGTCFRLRFSYMALYLTLAFGLFVLPWDHAVDGRGIRFGARGAYAVNMEHFHKGQMDGIAAPHLAQGSKEASPPGDSEDRNVSHPESGEKTRSSFRSATEKGTPDRQESQSRFSEPLGDQTVDKVHHTMTPHDALAQAFEALRDQANAFGQELQRQAASKDSFKESGEPVHPLSVKGTTQHSHTDPNIKPTAPTSIEDPSHSPLQQGARLIRAGEQPTASHTKERNLFARRQNDQFSDHPYHPGRSELLWKYQFVLIVGALVAIFLLQMTIDFTARKRLQPFSRISTCLMLGANFRDLGETKIVLFARFLTCTFLHLHVVHLFCNILCMFQSWIYLVQVIDIDKRGLWIYHWTFTLFMLSAFAGSFYSYHTTLKTTGFSIGASGGCLGLSLAFLTFAVLYEGFYQHRVVCLLYLLLIIVFACAPWERIASKNRSQKTDTGAHLGGLICGALWAVLLWSLHKGNVLSGYTLMRIADIASIILLVLLAVAYLEVAKEHIVDGRELLVRAYVKWLHMDEQCLLGADGRRHTDPGRLNCERLTEAFLYLLENEMIEDDPDTVIARLHEEAGMRCKSLPELGGCAV